MSRERVPREHSELFLLLKRTLTTDDLEDIKIFLRADEFGGFQYAEREKLKDVIEMLCELEVRGVIRVGDYRKLREIMRSIGNVAVIKHIDQTEELLHEKGYGIASTESNTEMTSKRVSEPHQPLDNSSGYAPTSPRAGNKRQSSEHQSISDTSGIVEKKLRVLALDRTDLAQTSGEAAELMVTGGLLQAADKVEEMLRNRYKTTGSFVQIIPWVGDDMKPISDIYTKLKLQNTDHKGEQLKSYEDMFLEKTNKGLSIQRIVLKGIAGVGKSTLIDKIAYDWANGEKLKEYKLVFVLKMFALEESSEFVDEIFNQLVDVDADVSKADLRSYITTNPAKVLILFDGFDELKTTNVSEASQSSGNVYQILNRKMLRGSCVVVTTRPSHFPKLVSKSLIEKPFVHVEVLGFNGEDIEQYIRRFFSKEHDKAEGLIQKIISSEVLFDLAKSPMLLLLMCILWREQSTIPDTMYRLYKDAFRYIFKRKQLPDETTQVVVTIGKNALDDLLSPHQFLSFKEGDFEDQALRSALKAGVLTSQRVIKGLDTRHSVSFIHRTFQEYCAAIFFQSLLGTDAEQFNTNLDRVGSIMKDGSQGLEYFLRFCCGDSQSCTNKVLSLLQKYPEQRMMIEKELSVKCYFEGQFEDLPSVDLVTEEMNIQGYSNDGLRALFYYLKHVNADDKRKGREIAQLGKVTRLIISRCNLESFGEVLGQAMSGMINLSFFYLNDCSVTPAGMKYIASSFVSTPKLTRIDISLNDKALSIGGSVPTWGHYLRSLKLLETFTLLGVDLQHKDLKNIAASLGCMKNLVHCQLSRNKVPTEFLFPSPCYKEWYDPRKETSLLLTACSTTSSELSDILSGLKTREDSFKIYLSENSLLGGLANTWAQHLKDLKLRELDLRDCALQSRDIEPLAGSLSDMSTLATLNLSCNPSLGGNAVSWAAHLGQLNQLEEINLRVCSLTGVDIEPIAKSVGNVQTLNLGGNTELRHSVASWAPSLRHLEHVKSVILNRCDFTYEDQTLIRNVEPHKSYFTSKFRL